MTTQIESGSGCTIAKPAALSTNTQASSCFNITPESPAPQPLQADRGNLKLALELLAAGQCPLPVCPALPAEKYPAHPGADGKPKLDKNGDPIPGFTGKNPSYVTHDGHPLVVYHGKYKDTPPTEADIRDLFENPANGIGLLGGYGGVHCIDIDRKDFATQADCDAAFLALQQNPLLAGAPIDRTPGGGYHILIRLSSKPGFTNLSVVEGGHHAGELLGHGRFFVTAPTLGPDGKSYETIQTGEPPLVEDLGAIGIYKYSASAKKSTPPKVTNSAPKPKLTANITPGCAAPIDLDRLVTDNTRSAIAGDDWKGDRSDTLTTAANDIFGWGNFCQTNNISISGDPESLVYEAGRALDLDDDRIERIIKTIDTGAAQPSCVMAGGDESAWKRVWKLEPAYKPAKAKKAAKPKGFADTDKKRNTKYGDEFDAVTESIGDRLAFNELTQKIEFDGEPADFDDIERTLALDHDVEIRATYVLKIITAVAKTSSYHPIRDYLDRVAATHGTDTSAISNLATRFFGTDDRLYDIYMMRTLIAAAARVRNPGCKMDTVTLLTGTQGVGKSTLWAILAGDWFDDSLGGAGDRDERMKLHASWILEWAELSALKRRDSNEIKNFTSCSTDNIRLPYGRSIVTMPRASIIVGTTNDAEFLGDATGNRRFWVCPVKQKIDTVLLTAERDAIWAAAVAAYDAGEPWWLTEEEDIRSADDSSDYATTDPWDAMVTTFIAYRSSVRADQVLTDLFKIESRDLKKTDQMRVTAILQRSDWTKTRATLNGQRQTIWMPPPVRRDDELGGMAAGSNPGTATVTAPFTPSAIPAIPQPPAIPARPPIVEAGQPKTLATRASQPVKNALPYLPCLQPQKTKYIQEEREGIVGDDSDHVDLEPDFDWAVTGAVV
jgi:predicted P-loop ATPase